MASTIVTVLPVPGGPNIRYGAGLEVPATTCRTASFCSAFLLRLELYRLEGTDREKKENETKPRPKSKTTSD